MHLVNVNFSSNSSRKKWPTHKKTIGLTSTHIVYKFSEVGKGGGVQLKFNNPKIGKMYGLGYTLTIC